MVLDAIAARPEPFVGIAVVDPKITDVELDSPGHPRPSIERHDGPGTPLALMERFARRVGPLGMHLQLHLGQSDDVLALAPLADAGLDVVIDPMGSITAAEGPTARGFLRLADLVRHCDHVR